MFKLFTVFVILALFGVVVTVAIKLFSDEKPSPQNEKISKEDIDTIIEELEFRVLRAEVSAEKGISEAEDTLKYLKEQLEKARTIQSKLK